MNSIQVSSNMTRSFVSVPWNQPIREAWNVMEEGMIRHLPVLGQDGALVGILEERDVMRAMGGSSGAFRESEVVADYMTWPVTTVDEKTLLLEAVDKMLEEKLSAMLVTREEEVVGIITTSDMLSVLRELLLHEGKGGRLGRLDLTYEPVWREGMNTLGAVGF